VVTRGFHHDAEGETVKTYMHELKGLSPEQQKQLILSIGSHRATRPLTPLEVGSLLRIAISAGSTPQELAAFVHLDGSSMISRFCRLLDLAGDVYHLIDWGNSQSTIGFTAASELARLTNHDEQRAAIRAALENKLSSSEIKQLVQSRLRSNRDIQACIAEIIGMRPRIERINLFIGSVTSPDVRQKLSGMTQHERDTLLSQLLRESYPDLRNVSARLGIERFTITGGDDDAAKLKARAIDFETQINSQLGGRWTVQ